MMDNSDFTQEEITESLYPIAIEEKKLHPFVAHEVQRGSKASRKRTRILFMLTLFSVSILGLAIALPFYLSSPALKGGNPLNQDAPLISQATSETSTSISATPTNTAITSTTSTQTQSTTATVVAVKPPASTQTPIVSTPTPTATSPANPTPLVTASLRYSFEGSKQGFIGTNTEVNLCSNRAMDGNSSLCSNINYGATDKYPYIYMEGNPISYNLAGKTISASVFVESAAGVIVSADWSLLASTSNNTWVESQVFAIPSGSWYRISYTIPQNYSAFYEMGLDFYTSPLHSNVTVYIDSISW